MSEYEHAVFVSYAWGGESEDIVNQIDQALQTRGIKIVRDKRDVDYRDSISKFMERLGRGDCVIVVISDRYLRSRNCMFELVEIAENKQFADRIFPVILSDAKIYDPVDRLDYVEFWEREKKKLDERMRNLTDLSNLQGIHEELDNYDRFRDKISVLTTTLKDMNVLTPAMHQNAKFDQLCTDIEDRLKATQGSAKIGTQRDDFVPEYFEPETIRIPAGPFWMGGIPGTIFASHEGPQHEVTLPEYRIGKYPVTNAQYEYFIRDTRRPVAPEMGWDGLKVPNGAAELPAAGVTWYDAMAYCEWLSKKTSRKYSLPNEAQWEKACRADTTCIYPWGDEFDQARCNHGGPTLAPVRAYLAQSSYGCFDLVGNVRQWTITLWGEKRITPDPQYSYPWKEDGRNDLNASRQIRRVVRGSSYKDDINLIRCSARSGQSPDDVGLPGARHGFRVIMYA